MGAFHLPGLVTQMDTLQDAVNTQPITIKAGHISINPHTFTHVLPTHGLTQIKLISPKQSFMHTRLVLRYLLFSFSFFLIPIHWYCSSSNACICMIGLNGLATHVPDGSKKICSLGTSKQPRTASLIQTMQHTKYKNFDTFTPNQWTFELTFILFSSSAFSFLFWLQLLKEFSRSSGFHSLLCVQEGATATFPSQFVQQILFFRRINACLVLNYPGPFFFFSFPC